MCAAFVRVIRSSQRAGRSHKSRACSLVFPIMQHLLHFSAAVRSSNTKLGGLGASRREEGCQVVRSMGSCAAHNRGSRQLVQWSWRVRHFHPLLANDHRPPALSFLMVRPEWERPGGSGRRSYWHRAMDCCRRGQHPLGGMAPKAALQTPMIFLDQPPNPAVERTCAKSRAVRSLLRYAFKRIK